MGRTRATPAVALLTAAMLGCTAPPAVPTAPPVAVASTAASPRRNAPPAPPAATQAPVTMPAVARQTVLYEVVIRTTDAATADFAATLHQVLTDPRGWRRAGFDFIQRSNAPYRIVLAEGGQVDRLCEPMDTYGKYSCQNGPVVALNADRWRSATPQWTGDLVSYRVMLINHEVGHLLHLHHPTRHCPGKGLPAPVMAQQSTELGTCAPNPWPLQWEIELATQRREPLAPGPQHETDDHRPTPPAVDR